MSAGERRETRVASRLRQRRARHVQRHFVYRLSVAAAGFAILAVGLALLVLPGPGLLVCAVGLGLLALEFRWAERMLVRVIEHGASVGRRLRRR